MVTSSLCSILDCGKQVRARGWCQSHWLRWYRHGDPLSGGSSRTAARRYLENVVLLYDGPECLFWPFDTDGSGYARIGMNGKRLIVSRFVCAKVRGPAPTPSHEAAHSCGNGHLACVAKSHLSWKTRAGIFADKLVHNTHNRGERNGAAKLTQEQVRLVRSLLGQSRQIIAAQVGTSAANVDHILRGDSWSWLT